MEKYRDGLFRHFFNDKARLLDLCNALLGTNGTDPDEIVINTLDGVFFGRLKNDLSCLYRNNFLILIEQQSTPNENMPLRMLFYVAELLKQYIEPQRENMYRLKQIKLPTPRFYLFYNGTRHEVERRQMKLSTAFQDFSGLELVVDFYNLNAGNNERFIERSKNLDEYCFFVNRVEENKSAGMRQEEAIAEAINYCISRGIMTEYLGMHKKEVASMLDWEYDDELAKKVQRQEAYEEGYEEAYVIGREEQKIDMIKNMLKEKFPIAGIARAAGWSEDKVLQIAKEI